MTTRRGLAAIATAPLLLGALTGAASDPALTFHGVFDGLDIVAGTCQMSAIPTFIGVWNVQIPDPGGDVGYVTFNSRSFDNPNPNPHVLTWQHMRSQLRSATDDSFTLYADSAMWNLPQRDRTLLFTLEDGQFTYHYEDHSGSGCVINFSGHETN
ncbi:MAG TPA: hypothetical protein VF143_08025 [Candidatus Nanopelagicales bacterium]